MLAGIPDQNRAALVFLENAVALRSNPAHGIQIFFESRELREISINEAISVSDDTRVRRMSCNEVDPLIWDLFQASSVTNIGLDLGPHVMETGRYSKS